MNKSLCVRLACVSAASLLAGLGIVSEANAGAFGISEQSTDFQGSAFAGAAAGGDVSSMFWNSAAITTVPGFNAGLSGTIVSATSDLTATGGLLTSPPYSLLVPNRTTDIGTEAFIPATYGSFQISDKLFAGIAVNSPFGYTTKPDSAWSGSFIATTSRIRSLNFNPALAYKITPEISIGAGVQVEYFRAKVDSLTRDFDANGWGVGGTVGVLWQPSPLTSIGLGYRSEVSESISGLYSGLSPNVGPVIADTNAKLTLPGQLTLSGRQVLTDRFTALATVEWQNASSIGNVSANSSSCGGACETLNFNYRDQWYFSLGGEYIYNPSLLLRAGVSYEIAPLDNSNRNIQIPDSNRLGISIGGSYKYSDHITFDLAYTHLFFDDAPFCMASALGTGTTHCVPNTLATYLVGSADTSADLFSVGAKYQMAPPPALEPYK